MGKKLTTEEFIKKANKKHNGKYDYSKVEYIDSHTKVCIICPEHGEFWQEPANHLSGQNCPKCASIEVHTNQSNKKEGFIQKAKEIHGDKYDYSKVEYINNHTKVCIICPEHGEFWQKPIHHTQGKGCPYCGGTKKLSTEEFIKRANEIHKEKYDYSKVDYLGADTKVCIICPEHGEFWQTPHNHISGKQGCPECNTSKNSKIVQKIETILKEFNIQYIKEKTFDWLKNKSHMYLDFFLPDYNVGIECHGLQHFEPVEYFGGKIEYDRRYEMDKLKYKLCSEHDIKIYYFTDIDSEYFEKLYFNENNLIEDICKQK